MRRIGSVKRPLFLLIVQELLKNGNAEYDPQNKKSLFIYWKSPSEWSELIYKWAKDNGFTNSICTLYELLNGESTEDCGKRSL